MKAKPNHQERLQQMQDFNVSRLSQPQPVPYLLNTKLTSNPFLKDQEMFHYILYKLNEYNKKISNKQPIDSYQSMIFEKLHSMTSDLAQIQQRSDQVTRLEEVFKWFKQQEKLMDQRKEQGQVRYKILKQTKNRAESPKKEKSPSVKSHKGEIPSDKLARHSLPFKKKWRTIHKELQTPPVRLEEYKRKMIHIVPFNEPKTQKKAPRVLYPKIQKIQQPVEDQGEDVLQEGQQGQEGQENKQGKQGQQTQPQIQGQQGQVIDGQPPVQEQQQGLDFGEPPEEPDEDEGQQEEVKDKLAPKFKPYTREPQDLVRSKEYKNAYLFYRGEEQSVERRMEDRYIQKKSQFLQKQKQDEHTVKQMNQWGVNRSKVEKQLQKKLQSITLRARYSFSEEDPPQIERINPKDELKYGFSMEIRTRPSKHTEVDISDFQLPKISESYKPQKEVNRDRLRSLKNKFKNMLNLTENQQRQTENSLCQYSTRRRGLSEILKVHSKSKQRLKQLDEATEIKEKLARIKAGVDMKSLSMGLCSPQDEQKVLESMFPSKELPKNPFWVEPAKKKKKKKK